MKKKNKNQTCWYIPLCTPWYICLLVFSGVANSLHTWRSWLSLAETCGRLQIARASEICRSNLCHLDAFLDIFIGPDFFPCCCFILWLFGVFAVCLIRQNNQLLWNAYLLPLDKICEYWALKNCYCSSFLECHLFLVVSVLFKKSLCLFLLCFFNKTYSQCRVKLYKLYCIHVFCGWRSYIGLGSDFFVGNQSWLFCYLLG